MIPRCQSIEHMHCDNCGHCADDITCASCLVAMEREELAMLEARRDELDGPCCAADVEYENAIAWGK